MVSLRYHPTRNMSAPESSADAEQGEIHERAWHKTQFSWAN
jgi:hypothetical protein